ncbi:uncharacterized protein LOC124441913 [Xenia sp. Carnegie-2017]|uniref:uncharacterized protein LOC124441913 n=1 Tax=Xenia sp. Carnegie-2017 TaxID=2897299 RepID=UPI001F03E072|nr:uncharacterized protein LOC124441913 [Xenia sp. Carnegie-2017]
MASAASRIGLIILSLLQMVLLVIALGFVGFFVREMNKTSEREARRATIALQSTVAPVANDMGIFGREESFLFSSAIGIIIAFISMIIAISQSHSKAPCAASMVTAHILLLLLLVVSSSILANTAEKYDSLHLCKSLKENKSDTRCTHLTAGVALAFISVVLFIGSTVIYCASLLNMVHISFINMESVLTPAED